MLPLMSVFIGLAMTAMLIGCGDAGTKSSEAEITALTLKIGDKNYASGSSLTIEGTAIIEIIPQASPGSVTVEAVTLSLGAKSLAVGDSLTLVNGSATTTITAEDGTTEATYTLTVTKSVVASELARSAEVVNGIVPDEYRVNFGAFSFQTGSSNFAGEYRLAVRPTAKTAPSATGYQKLLRHHRAPPEYHTLQCLLKFSYGHNTL